MISNISLILMKISKSYVCLLISMEIIFVNGKMYQAIWIRTHTTECFTPPLEENEERQI